MVYCCIKETRAFNLDTRTDVRAYMYFIFFIFNICIYKLKFVYIQETAFMFEKFCIYMSTLIYVITYYILHFPGNFFNRLWNLIEKKKICVFLIN